MNEERFVCVKGQYIYQISHAVIIKNMRLIFVEALYFCHTFTYLTHFCDTLAVNDGCLLIEQENTLTYSWFDPFCGKCKATVLPQDNRVGRYRRKRTGVNDRKLFAGSLSVYMYCSRRHNGI